jgi:O-antigen/teichoic acid export membrane protein
MAIESTSGPKPPGVTPPAVPSTLRNVISNWGGFAFSTIVNFFLAPFVVRHLGNSLYGISVLIMSLTGYLGLLDLGVRGAMTRFIAKFQARAEHEEASGFTSAALAVFGVGGVLALLLSLVMATRAELFSVPGMSASRVRVLLILGGLNVAASLVSGVFSGIPMALQRFDHVNMIAVASTIFRAVCIVAALSAGGGLIALVCIQLAYTLGATVASAGVSLRLYPQLRVRLGNVQREAVSLILSFSVYSFTLLVFDIGIMYLSSVVLGAFVSANLVTFFWIAASLVNYSRTFVAGISKTSTPQASALEAQGDIQGLQRSLLSGASYATLAILPIAATFALRGSSFIGLWMGAEYADLSGRVLLILSLGLAISASNQVALATMLGISKHRAVGPAFLMQAACTVAATLATVRIWGVVGVAWSTTLPYIGVSLLFWPWYLRQNLRIPMAAYVFSTWVKPTLALAPFALSTYAVERFWPAPNLLFFFLQTGAILPVAVLGFWYFYLTREHREALGKTVLQPAWQALRQRF